MKYNVNGFQTDDLAKAVSKWRTLATMSQKKAFEAMHPTTGCSKVKYEFFANNELIDYFYVAKPDGYKFPIERFIERIEKEYSLCREETLKATKEEIYDYMAYSIAETQAIRDFLTREDIQFLPVFKELMKFDVSKNLLIALYQFEIRFNDPLWTTPDGLMELVEAFCAENQ